MLLKLGGVIVALRREPDLVLPDGEIPVPVYLRAGPCSQVWDPVRPAVPDEWPNFAVRVHVNYRNVLRGWLEVNHLQRDDARLPECLRKSHGPWPFIATEPERMARILAWRGLPPDWTPTPAPEPLRRLKNRRPYGDPLPPDVVAILRIQGD